MSLTSHLKDNGSPVYRFTRERFPRMRAAVRAANVSLKNAETVRPEGEIHWGTVGAAADHRIRYYFGAAHEQSGAVREGARMIEQGSMRGTLDEDNEVLIELIEGARTFGKSVPEFFVKLDTDLARLRPGRRRLKAGDEGLMCRYCSVLALFEQVYRLGRMPPGSPLSIPEPAGTAAELLVRVPETWVADLRVLSWIFHDSQEGFVRNARRVALAPTFEGSRDVGGADADLILDGCLMDVKTTTTPKVNADMLHQLLGYVLLDYADEYDIRAVAVYMARQGELIRWELGELLGALGCENSLQELRHSFAEALHTI